MVYWKQQLFLWGLCFSLAFSVHAEMIQREDIPKAFAPMDYCDRHEVPAFTDKEQARGFMLFSRPLTAPVYPQTVPHAYERVECLRGFGAQGQIVNLNVAVYPLRSLKALRVRDSGGLGERQLRRVVYWKVRYPDYTSQHGYRRNPEYLYPHEESVDVSLREPVRFLLTVRLPETVPGGRLEGKLMVSHGEQQAVIEIPYAIDVLPFDLKRDPSKHFSAYNYTSCRSSRHPVSQKHLSDANWQHRATVNKLRAMVDYGFTFPPFLYVDYCAKDEGFLYIQNFDRYLRDEFRKAGMPVPFMVLGVECIYDLYREFTGKHLRGHMMYETEPPEEMYEKLDRLLKGFLAHAKAEKYPPMIFAPVDEPDYSTLPMVRRIYEIFKKNGCTTYITSCPYEEKLSDVVDYWSDQPFRDFSEVQRKDKRMYWCYPNHNSYEIKDMATMTRGGRMTYGFGFWKSGYDVLIPWAWMPANPIHMRQDFTSGGNRIMTDGTTVMTPYWECFREGIIDGQYIYTLSEAIVQREPASDPELVSLLKEARELLQNCWRQIPVCKKYLGEGHFADDDFDAWRGKLGSMTAKLLRYPATNARKATSIIVPTADVEGKSAKDQRLSEESKRGNLVLRSLDKEEWIACEPEATLKRVNGQLQLTVEVNHDKGQLKAYPVGWPRMRGMLFKREKVDFTKYDFLMFRLKVSSNRDGERAVKWPRWIEFFSAKGKTKGTLRMTERMEPGQWQTFMIPISQIMKLTRLTSDMLTSITDVQFGISERDYKHGDRLDFEFDSMNLVALKQPILWQVKCPRHLLKTANVIRCDLAFLGEMKGNRRIVWNLLKEGREVVRSQQLTLPETVNQIGIPLTDLQAGRYVLQIQLGGSEQNVLSRDIEIVEL